MAPSLSEGIEEKLRRAAEHIDTFQDETSAFFGSNPYTIRFERQPDGLTDVFYADVHLFPPPRLPIIIGDAVHNMRSALDHIVFGLSERHSGTIPPEKAKRINFPVYDSPDSKRKWDQLRYLDAASQAVVMCLQPYCTPDTGILDQFPSGQTQPTKIHPLTILRILSNRDKHRALLVAQSNIVGAANWVSDLGELFSLEAGPIQDGAEIGRFLWNRPPSDPEVTVPIEFAINIAFEEFEVPRRWSAKTVLGAVLDFIRDEVVPRFSL